MRQVTTKRRKALVDPEVQGGVLKKIVFHWGIFFICNALALTIWIRLFEQPDVAWGETFSDTIKRFLPFFVISLALIPAFVWDTLTMTNRFAGPIMRLRRALADASQGRAVAPLHFREDDFWSEIATSFNLLMEHHASAKTETQVDERDAGGFDK